MNEVNVQTLSAIDPATEEVFESLALTGPSGVDAVVNRARSSLETSLEWRIPGVRSAALFEMSRLLMENIDELALSESRDTGKPLSQGRDDVKMAAAYFTYYAGWVDKFGGRSIPLGPDYVDYLVREPWGICAQIIPWNYPLQVTARCAAPALACGNAVVLKPSEQASVTPLRLQELTREAGIPEGLFSIVIGAGDVGSALVQHPGVDHVTFVGSAAVGQSVARQCLDRFIPVVLEKLRSALESLSIGPGVDDHDVGPLISSRQLQHAEGMLERAREAGARVVCGGGRPAHLTKGWYLEPTLLDMVDSQSEIFQEEVFGPVLVAASFDSDDDAIRLANSTKYALVAGLWTTDYRRVHSLAARLVAGQVFVNGYGVGGGVALPFGGLKKSGHARGKAEEAMLAYSWVKNICVAL